MERKPAVYGFVIIPLFVFGSLCQVIALTEVYSSIRGVPRSAMPNVNGMLIILPAVFLWIPNSLLLGNLILYSVPSLRRTAEEYAARTGQPGFAQSQEALLKALAVCGLVCVPLIVLGFVL